MEFDKIYLKPGDVVQLKQHELMHSPAMLVIRKEVSLFKNDHSLKGIKCRWFTTSGLMQEAVFNTKDLILVK